MFSLSRPLTGRRRSPLWRSFRRQQEGAVAVEFGILVFPFLAIVGLIMETSFQAYSLASLDDALRRGSRGLQLGSVQTQGKNVNDFKKDVCRLMEGWMSCANLIVEVRPVILYDRLDVKQNGPDGVQTGRMSPIKANQSDNPFCPGTPGSLTLVRANYKIPSLFGIWITSSVAGQSVIASSHTFRTEPFNGDYEMPASCSSLK